MGVLLGASSRTPWSIILRPILPLRRVYLISTSKSKLSIVESTRSAQLLRDHSHLHRIDTGASDNIGDDHHLIARFEADLLLEGFEGGF